VPDPRPTFRFLTDAQLLAQCRTDHYRGSGPGGQKRNKTSNAVRLHHDPTGIIVTGTESRSLKENHLNAVRRLRVKLAADVREPVDLPRFDPPDWWRELRRGDRLELSHRHPHYAAAGGLVLDLLTAAAGNPAAVAVNLGVSTTTVVKLIESDPHWWATANEIRRRFGLGGLVRR
jgi:hypothetical protein